MKAAGVEFNALTHSLLVESFVVQNDHQAAADAHYEAQAAGNPIRPESFEKLISRCERNGAYDLMVRLCLTPSIDILLWAKAHPLPCAASKSNNHVS